MIIFDTHVLLWLMFELHKLGEISKNIIQTKFSQQLIAIPAICFWEIEMLQRKQRINLGISTIEFRSQLLLKGFQEVATNGSIGILADQLTLHPDSADRLITATAIYHNYTLLTADGKIIDWQLSNPNLKLYNAKK
ncbi:type II toxin-antitoxin system VapC family toxin [Faucicola mancuniensis]|uniref:type II toxin-antitoxin system VapC family toxin n=1 Tax=Faucicola mancuniensis TaxID=1309795 RepID=UPI0028E54BD4|nr:type II toxin-antitoxin system VapC family toxin [uncultured Moraxella sp.]